MSSIITREYDFSSDPSSIEDLISSLSDGVIIEAVYVQAMTDIIFNDQAGFKIGNQADRAKYANESILPQAGMAAGQLHEIKAPFPVFVNGSNSDIILTIPKISSGRVKIWVKYIDL